MRALDRILDGDRRISALLGPTNTGKTHRAIQRMLQHPSGMIGLPLRLLAREVYDRVVALRGADSVALVTGEEKRVPPRPAFFVCTVEAMPVDRPVAFLAVDEIQLAGDRNRGHVFTDRLLHARGVLETMFLGSDTIEPLLAELVPHARIERLPRLSRLSWAGTHRLTRVPRRSAVVAFSAEQVYRSAEAIRAAHGGVAVVLGALSPRTRNAQVELYEAGEVQHLVATDAVGMGLNLDVRHVAFAALRKFDGRRHRDLRVDELAQIAGRAGRHERDGTFGTLRELGPLDPEAIEALEGHRFPPLQRLFWRNPELDFRSVERLLRTLRAPSPHPLLKPVYDEDDHRTLEELARVGDLPLDDADAVRLAWEVCRIPDYRKTLTGSHVELLHQIAVALLARGTLEEDWIGGRLADLDRPEGDIDALMARIAFVRTWTYVSHQRGWLADPGHWQERTRQIEDRLSDALHHALRERFVGEGSRRTGSAARTDPEEAARAGRVLGAAPEDLALDPSGRWWFGDEVVGGLAPGPAALAPRAVASRTAFPSPHLRAEVRAWLQARTDTLLRDLASAWTGEGRLSAAAERVVAALEEGLGSCPRHRVRHAIRQLDGAERDRLRRRGVRIGRRSVYASGALGPEAVALRSALWAVSTGSEGRLVPGGAPPSFPRTDAAADPWLSAIGYAPVGPLAVRVDVLEDLVRDGLTAAAAARALGCASEVAEVVLRALR